LKYEIEKSDVEARNAAMEHKDGHIPPKAAKKKDYKEIAE
jgi:hypothetical protein